MADLTISDLSVSAGASTLYIAVADLRATTKVWPDLELATSTAANRFLCANDIDVTVNKDATVVLNYDSTVSRWRVFSGGGDTSTLVPKSAYTGKGVLLGASAADTPLALAAGTDDYILMADAAAASGLKWAGPGATPSTQAFGDSAAAGTTDGFERAGHKHAMPALTAVVQPDHGGIERVTAIGNSGSSQTLDISAGNLSTVTNSASCTYTMPSGLTSGVAISFSLIVTNNGAYTATFTGVKWAGGVVPVLTSGAGKVDIFTFTTVDGGTTWYGFRSGQAMA